jgi:hypothetical protein
MNYFLILLMSLFLNVSCGLNKEAEEKTSRQNLQSAQLQVQETEPNELGTPWKREFKLSGNDVDRWNVERQCFDETNAWQSIGITDSQGYFVDENIGHAKCRYRIGGNTHQIDWLAARKDIELTGELFEDKSIHADRIFIQENHEFLIRHHTLNLKADKIYIDGALRAYSPAETGNALNAGKLNVMTNYISVEGIISLTGINGAQGPKGSPQREMGRTGHRGGTGKNGGNGGYIELFFQEISDHEESYDVRGGLAGPGGLGGNGGPRGRRRVCEARPENGTHCYYESVSAGRRGSSGEKGHAGLEGSIVRQQLNL